MSQLAASGDDSKLASSGDDSICACAAAKGRFMVGKRGVFALGYFTESEGWNFRIGKVGVNDIKANKWYTLNAENEIVED